MDRTPEEILASVETHIIYINNHLQSIDSHLERLNNSEDKQNVAITKNKTNIGWVVKIGGGVLFIIATIAATALGLTQLLR